MSASWVIVSGDVGPWGGQDRANHALASFLVARGDPVHVVAHRIDSALAALPGVTADLVPRPLRSHFAGGPLLAAAGMRAARRALGRDRRTRVLVNGGNCAWPDVNWVHAVHRVWPCRDEGAPVLARVKNHVAKALHRRMERRAVSTARLLLANSERTRLDLVRGLGIPKDRIAVQYLGCDPVRFGPVEGGERARVREQLGVGQRFVAVFVGALGYDHNKGFDTLLRAWRTLASEPEYDAVLLAAGAGALPHWRRIAAAAGVASSVRFLGSVPDVSPLLAAADLFVGPSRYESYGLSVHEAICRGVPAITSRRAGVAERYPDALRDLLVPDPEDSEDLAARIRRFWKRPEPFRAEVARLATSFRARTWSDMAADVVRTIESSGERR